MFHDLQIACSDLGAYSKLHPRPPYGKYAKWLESCEYEAGLTFWLARYMNFDNLKPKFPVLGLGGTPSVSTMKIKKLLHLPKMEDSEFSLPTMGRKWFSHCYLQISSQNYVLTYFGGAKASVTSVKLLEQTILTFKCKQMPPGLSP